MNKIDILEKKIEELAVRANQLKKENERLKNGGGGAALDKDALIKKVQSILDRVEELEG